MKPLGTILMIGGAAVGFAAGIWVLTGPTSVGLPWPVTVGLVKLTVLGSFGMMGLGAVLTRLANKSTRGAPPTLHATNDSLLTADRPQEPAAPWLRAPRAGPD